MTTKTNKTVEKINKQNSKFAEFLANAQKKAAELEIAKEEARKMKKSSTTNFSPFANVVMLIFNAGLKGITVADIMQQEPKQYERRDKVTKELVKQTSFSIDSVKRDWNKANHPLQYANNRLIEKEGLEVVFLVEEAKPNRAVLNCAHNNRIILPNEFAEDVKVWLLAQTNIDAEWLTRK